MCNLCSNNYVCRHEDGDGTLRFGVLCRVDQSVHDRIRKNFLLKLDDLM